MKLLCVGDIHLGRQPSRLPGALLDRVPRRALGPGAAWERTVALALTRRVDAVLLAGDVVEQSDDFYEAYADLRRGVEQLSASGIAVLAVAGNHDVEVLPRLAEAVPGFRLLGRAGTWGSCTVRGGDGAEVDVLGWSFPETVVHASPLDAGLPPRRPTTTIGLLHCDRDQAGSRYAPVRSSELSRAPVDAWLLGHIHKPDPLSGRRPMGYLGSLTGLDPGESGPRGPWLLEVAGGSLTMEHLPLAPLRWEEVAVPVDELHAAEDIHGLVVTAIAQLHERIAGASHVPRAVGCRLRLSGRTALRQTVERELAAADPARRFLDERDGIVYFVHHWRLEASPAVDLDELARGSDPAGLIARKLQVLRGPDSPERRRLVQAAQRALNGVCGGRDFAPLGGAPPDPPRTAAILESAALRALDELLAQREGAG